MNGVHAALQDGVNHACEINGTPAYKLAEQPGYGTCYQLYCKKSAARSGADSGNNVHLSMTADDLSQMCDDLVASDNKEDMRNLAMILYQFATVSRGDDVRPRKLSELMVRYLKSVGESCTWKAGGLHRWVKCVLTINPRTSRPSPLDLAAHSVCHKPRT